MAKKSTKKTLKPVRPQLGDGVEILNAGSVPVCGLPGCVMYAKRTIFDLLLPRLLADDPITAEDIARLGEGGLCLGCAECHWPNCGFGHF